MIQKIYIQTCTLPHVLISIMKPQFLKLMEWFNPLQPGIAYLYPLTTSENLGKQHRAVMGWDSIVKILFSCKKKDHKFWNYSDEFLQSLTRYVETKIHKIKLNRASDGKCLFLEKGWTLGYSWARLWDFKISRFLKILSLNRSATREATQTRNFWWNSISLVVNGNYAKT